MELCNWPNAWIDFNKLSRPFSRINKNTVKLQFTLISTVTMSYIQNYTLKNFGWLAQQNPKSTIVGMKTYQVNWVVYSLVMVSSKRIKSWIKHFIFILHGFRESKILLPVHDTLFRTPKDKFLRTFLILITPVCIPIMKSHNMVFFLRTKFGSFFDKRTKFRSYMLDS